ncbi:MAG: glycosyltransferase [Succinivibrio sp.]|nr:glycosyltransferase [Succinivibrio sp.]
MSKVSIVIPIYNVENYLRNCLDSVIAQTLKDIEIICVNDGSTDNSLAILKEYSEITPRIVIVDRKNSGYGSAVNAGIDKATGEYIGIVESDDIILPEMYEYLYTIAKQNNLDLIKSDHFDYFSNKNTKLKKVVLDKSHSLYNKVIDLSTTYSPYLCSMYTWSGLYKREYLNRYKIRHNETPGASFQDQGFWLQSFWNAKRAMFIDRAFYCYRRDNPGSSTLNKAKVFCCCDEYAFIEKKLQEQDDAFIKNFFPMFLYLKFLCYYGTFKRISTLFKEDFVERFHVEFKSYREQGILDDKCFSARDKRKLNELLANPKKFCLRYLNRSSGLKRIVSFKKIHGKKNLVFFGKMFSLKSK